MRFTVLELPEAVEQVSSHGSGQASDSFLKYKETCVTGNYTNAHLHATVCHRHTRCDVSILPHAYRWQARHRDGRADASKAVAPTHL